MVGLQGKSDTGIKFPERSVTSRVMARRAPDQSLTGQIIPEPTPPALLARVPGKIRKVFMRTGMRAVSILGAVTSWTSQSF